MADEQRTVGGQEEPSLLDRLQQQIDELERIEVSGSSRQRLDGVITGLRENVEEIKKIAFHLFFFVPKEPKE